MLSVLPIILYNKILKIFTIFILFILYEKHPPLILSSDSHNGKIESFIKNNKDELMKYYQNYNFDVRITNTHVYTKIKE